MMNEAISSQIKFTTASSTYNQVGEKKYAGHYLKRLVLGNDSRFHVRVAEKVKGLPSALFKVFYKDYVPLNVSINQRQKQVFVHIKSLERLHLSREEVLTSSKDGTLEALIQEKISKIEHLAHCIDHFKQIKSNYDVDHQTGHLLTKETQAQNNGVLQASPRPQEVVKANARRIDTCITKKGLMQALTDVFSRVNKGDSKLYRTQIEGRDVSVGYRSEDQKPFLIFTDNLFVDNENHQSLIAAGSFGEVRKVWNVTEGKQQALKLMRKDSPSDVFVPREIDNALYICRLLHEENGQLLPDLTGIVNLFEGKVELEPNSIGLVDKLYAGDAKNIELDQNHLSLGDQLVYMWQLLKGLERFQSKGILHGDIKPENIFVKRSKDDLNFRIGDLGGCRHKEALLENINEALEEIPEGPYQGDTYLEHIEEPQYAKKFTGSIISIRSGMYFTLQDHQALLEQLINIADIFQVENLKFAGRSEANPDSLSKLLQTSSKERLNVENSSSESSQDVEFRTPTSFINKFSNTERFKDTNVAFSKYMELDHKTDVFALGTALFYMFTGRHPYRAMPGSKHSEQRPSIGEPTLELKNWQEEIEQNPNIIANQIKALIISMIEPNIENRPTAQVVLAQVEEKMRNYGLL